MNWHKKTTNWPLYFFGLIAVGIIIATVILLILFVHKVKIKSEPVSQSAPIQSLSSLELKNNYQLTWQAIIFEVTSSTDQIEIASQIEKTFLSVRVPREFQSKHLSAWFNWLKLKQPENAEAVPEWRQAVVQIIEPLLYE